ncbi:MAG: hypothetical protein ACT4OU_07095, partial [Hyphomicrobium sp.]
KVFYRTRTQLRHRRYPYSIRHMTPRKTHAAPNSKIPPHPFAPSGAYMLSYCTLNLNMSP